MLHRRYAWTSIPTIHHHLTSDALTSLSLLRPVNSDDVPIEIAYAWIALIGAMNACVLVFGRITVSHFGSSLLPSSLDIASDFYYVLTQLFVHRVLFSLALIAILLYPSIFLVVHFLHQRIRFTLFGGESEV